MNVLLKSVTIIDSKSSLNGKVRDILIEKGHFSKIAAKIENSNGYKEIKLDNLHLSCGWFDTSVSFGEPGYEDRETIKNGLEVASKSGFTAVALNSNTNPYIDNKSIVDFLVNKSLHHPVSLYPIASLTKSSKGDDIAELFDMQNAGAVAFSDYKKSISNANLMKIALLYAQNFDGLIMSHPQDNSIVNKGIANEGEISTRLGLKGNPALAEELQIARDLFLLEYTGGKLHIPMISTAKATKLIKEAKKKGLNVSCSISAHHLSLTDNELLNFDARYKVTPPLRDKKDVSALLKGVKDGTIDMITSDHNPIDIENKKVEFENALDGTIGLESIFGAINNLLPLSTTIDCLSDQPRKRFGLEQLAIKEGEKVNITLFNPKFEYTFNEKNILSTSKNSLFLEKKLNGKVYGVFANNKLKIN